MRIPGRGLVQGSACARGCVCCTHTTCPWAAASCARSAPLARAVRRGCARRRPGWEGGGGVREGPGSPRVPRPGASVPPRPAAAAHSRRHGRPPAARMQPGITAGRGQRGLGFSRPPAPLPSRSPRSARRPQPLAAPLARRLRVSGG